MTRLPDVPSLDALLADPRRVAEVAVEAVGSLLDQLALDVDRRGRLRTLLLDRLRPASTAEPDTLLDADHAAQRLAVSKDWLRRRPTLPFVVRLSDGVVRYSSRGLAAYIAQHTAR